LAPAECAERPALSLSVRPGRHEREVAGDRRAPLDAFVERPRLRRFDGFAVESGYFPLARDVQDLVGHSNRRVDGKPIFEDLAGAQVEKRPQTARL